MLSLLDFATTETEEQLAIGLKTWNENLGDRKDHPKNFPSSPPILGARTRKTVCVSQVSVEGVYQLAPPIPLYLLSYHPLPAFLLLVPLEFSKICNSFTFSPYLPSSYSWYQSPSQMESTAQGYLFVIDIIIFLSRHNHIMLLLSNICWFPY